MKAEKVLIAGGTGLIGKNLSKRLIDEGYEVSVLSRSKKKDDRINYIYWNPKDKVIDDQCLESNHIINLAGAGIADKPWTKTRRKELLDSRINSTNLLFDCFSKNNSRLSSYVGASAIGYYGEGVDSWQIEDDEPTTNDFMTSLCSQWESAHMQFDAITDKVYIPRIGLVLSTQGGAYPKIRMPFKIGAGSYFGNGSQYYSWIHIDDMARLLIHLLIGKSTPGVYNAVAPEPLTNKELVEKIKSSLNLSALILPVPAFVLRTSMGEMSKVVLNSNRVSCKKIQEENFKFSYPDFSSAVTHLEKSKV